MLSKRSFFKTMGLALGLALTLGFTSQGQAQANRNVAQYNLAAGIGLKGWDPVAVFSEGGGRAQAGSSQITLEHSGVRYQFASERNRDLFRLDPEKYEPTYGGWCAYAMASGSKVDIQPQLFTINGSRAHYFVSARAKQNFDRDIQSYETRADDNWKQISGEEPRR